VSVSVGDSGAPPLGVVPVAEAVFIIGLLATSTAVMV